MIECQAWSKSLTGMISHTREMAEIMLQAFGISLDLSLLISLGSLVISLWVLIIYILRYQQQEEQLEEQRRQIDNQEKQLDAQRTQLEQQERELEQYQQELEELERQTELAELEHEAYIEVEDYEFEGDRVVLLLSNYGNGAATNLQLQTVLETNGPDHIKPTPAESPLRRRDGDGNSPFEAQALRPGEQRVEFEGEAIAGLVGPTGNTRQRSFRGLLMDLREMGTNETATVTFSVLAGTLTSDEKLIQVTEEPLTLSVSDAPNPISLSTAAEQKLRF